MRASDLGRGVGWVFWVLNAFEEWESGVRSQEGGFGFGVGSGLDVLGSECL